jgi:hypothetical protein
MGMQDAALSAVAGAHPLFPEVEWAGLGGNEQRFQ